MVRPDSRGWSDRPDCMTTFTGDRVTIKVFDTAQTLLRLDPSNPLVEHGLRDVFTFGVQSCSIFTQTRWTPPELEAALDSFHVSHYWQLDVLESDGSYLIRYRGSRRRRILIAFFWRYSRDLDNDLYAIWRQKGFLMRLSTKWRVYDRRVVIEDRSDRTEPAAHANDLLPPARPRFLMNN